MPTYLITGVTGGLGGSIWRHLVNLVGNDPNTHLIAGSSRAQAPEGIDLLPSNRSFRRANYDDLDSLTASLRGVDKFFFVSSNTFDNERRTRQHSTVVQAAKKAGVAHTYYSSLAFGGYGRDSMAGVMAAHLETETMLKNSGISYTSIREGLYADAFPIFIDWFPDTEEVLLTGDGPLAFASREELGEATAKVMCSGKYDKDEIILLSGPKSYTFQEVVNIINETTGRSIRFRVVQEDEYLQAKLKGDRTGKGEGFFRNMMTWYKDTQAGRAGMVTSTLKDVLGREPETGEQTIKRLLLEATGDYEWHQQTGKAK